MATGPEFSGAMRRYCQAARMIDNSDGFEIPTDFGPLRPEFLSTPINTLFDRVAERWPDRIAIEESQHHWTYRELQWQIDRLAALLAQAGAADQERPVALCLPTGAPVIAAMLATLKAGGFYVVIDPHYPVRRNTAILNDSAAEWVITDKSAQPGLDAHFPENRILMWHAEAVAGSPLRQPAFDPSSRRAAIVYTSGSTGLPKGAVHSQAFILNWTRLYVTDLHLCCSDRVSLLYSASVAGSIRDIYGALLTGATLLPITAREHSFDELARRLVDGRVSIYHSVMTLLRQLMTSQTVVRRFPDVRVLAFGGERVLARDLALIREQFPAEAMVYTSIGSTEAGTFARLFLRSDSDTGHTTVPLGFTPDDCRLILMDAAGAAVPDGEPGEIVVESRYLADGYWRNPQETAQVFCAAAQDPCLRRYRTGDRGVRDANGMLRHAGRTDRQFKVRGYRIEPAEIEAVLLTVPQVTNVIVQPDVSEDGVRIVAYLEGMDTHAIQTETLREHCATLLPQHMIPSVFHACEQFPRLANNKIDIQRLPQTNLPDTRGNGQNTDHHEASTVHQLWQAFFPDGELSAKADFFALGGDSLTAMRLMNRVADLCGVEVPVTLLFMHPTLGEFEKALHALTAEPEGMTSSPRLDSIAAPMANGQRGIPTLIYAQTNVQLYEQLFDAGYTPARLGQVAAAYDLVLSLFSALLRPEGKPFVNHLVGTASILAQHGAPYAVVIAGLLHAAYVYGEFGSIRLGATASKRRRVRAVIGEDAEALVSGYTRFPWNARSIGSLPEQLPGMSQGERNIILMRLANELEEGADSSLLYCAAETRLLKANYLGLSVSVAKAMDMPYLADELEECHQRNAVEHASGRPELGQSGVYAMPTLTRLKTAVCHALRRVRRYR
jgi:amino acid adenylation domain-containing protein